LGRLVEWRKQRVDQHAKRRRVGRPVIPLAMHQAEGRTVGDACKRLADAGADVVGLNCIRGPATYAASAARDPRSAPEAGAEGLR
jgi:hypothetical protein